MNASELGNVGYTATGIDATFHEYAAKQQDSKVTHHMESTIMHFAYMIEHENMVPKTYLDAMRTAERKQ
jgi:hypothetical protein